MKLVFAVSIFTVFLKIQQIHSFPKIGDNIIVNNDGNRDEVENIFQKRYNNLILEKIQSPGSTHTTKTDNENNTPLNISNAELKQKNVEKECNEKLKKADKIRAEAIADVEANRQKTVAESEKAQQQAEIECRKAYAQAEKNCRKEIKRGNEEIKRAKREFKKIVMEAHKRWLKTNGIDCESMKKKAEKDHRQALNKAYDQLKNAENKYNEILKEGGKQYEDAKKRAATRKQIAVTHYTASLKGEPTFTVKEEMEKNMDVAENNYAATLNQINKKWSEVQNDATKYWKKAQKICEENRRKSEYNFNRAVNEAKALMKKATDEFNETVGKAHIKLNKTEQSEKLKIDNACGEQRFALEDKAVSVKNETIEKLKGQAKEIQDLADEKVKMIGEKYQKEVAEIMKEYSDLWNNADALQQTIENAITLKKKKMKEAAENNKKNDDNLRQRRLQNNRSTNQNV